MEDDHPRDRRRALTGVVVTGERATIRWRYRFGEGDENSVRSVILMHVRNGKILEALGYVKAGLRS